MEDFELNPKVIEDGDEDEIDELIQRCGYKSHKKCWERIQEELSQYRFWQDPDNIYLLDFEKIKTTPTISKLLVKHTNLDNAVRILIEGCRGTDKGQKALSKWDEYRKKDSEKKDE